ncbi:MAG TPA: peptidoglycan DD-metalloendopeptidase family protein [Candidatus Limnocylindrales bacterium]
MRRSTPDRRGWSASRRARFGRRAVLFLFVLSTFGGLFTSTPPKTAQADELSDAYKKQQALQKLIDKQRASIKALTANQGILSGRISKTKHSLTEINANLLTAKTQVVAMVVDVARSQNAVDELDATSARLDAELAQIEADEATKQADLDDRVELLSSRIREAYNTDRTSILDTFLSGNDFTDVLTEAAYHLEFAEQDKLLAEQIVEDKKVLEVLHQNVVLARQQTEELHQLAATSKAALDAQLTDLKEARAELAKLEAETARLLKAQQAAYAKMAANKTRLAASLKAQLEADRKLEALINRLVKAALAKGGIPSQYNGTFRWPLDGRITQEFGCTGFSWEPAYGNCRHFHNGIDIANSMYTPVYAAGPGKVIWSGRSPYSSSWNVIIAHSSHLVTWYAHLDNKGHKPVVRAGQYVDKGQLIAYEGMTGNTTGPHLHWAVQLNENWVNPRLFLPR